MGVIQNATLALLSVAILAPTGAHAQTQPRATSKCTPDQFAERIDQTGAYLRAVSRKTEPELRRKFERLALARGWPPAEAEERGYDLIQDATIEAQDRHARHLLIELDKLGAVDTDTATCANLERLSALTRELRTVTNAKIDYIHQLLDAVLSGRTQQATSRPKAAASPAVPVPSTSKPAAKAPAPTSPATPRRRSAATHDWQPQTTPNLANNGAAPANPGATRAPRTPKPANLTYTSEEISHAGRGLFGTISANLASVIRYAFQTYGKPNGYILGTEGGGAFLAGLSYGTGELHTKMESPVRVYWQGPTVGYDLGLTGSRVMVLVYNLETVDDLFSRFGGVGGSAYVIGGVGLTFHQGGHIILAPIRTGLGLRIGANIGYLKFTRERSLNPF